MGLLMGRGFTRFRKPNPTKEIPAQAAYPGDWKAGEFKRSFHLSVGKKGLIPDLFGPHRLEDLKPPFAF